MNVYDDFQSFTPSPCVKTFFWPHLSPLQGTIQRTPHGLASRKRLYLSPCLGESKLGNLVQNKISSITPSKKNQKDKIWHEYLGKPVKSCQAWGCWISHSCVLVMRMPTETENSDELELSIGLHTRALGSCMTCCKIFMVENLCGSASGNLDFHLKDPTPVANSVLPAHWQGCKKKYDKRFLYCCNLEPGSSIINCKDLRWSV